MHEERDETPWSRVRGQGGRPGEGPRGLTRRATRHVERRIPSPAARRPTKILKNCGASVAYDFFYIRVSGCCAPRAPRSAVSPQFCIFHLPGRYPSPASYHMNPPTGHAPRARPIDPNERSKDPSFVSRPASHGRAPTGTRVAQLASPLYPKSTQTTACATTNKRW